MPDLRVSKTFLPHLYISIGIVCIGFSAIFVRLAAIPGIVSGFFRVFIASSVLLPLWMIRGAEFPANECVSDCRWPAYAFRHLSCQQKVDGD
jgi:hypothetical protein